MSGIELLRDTAGPEARTVRAGLLAHRHAMLPDHEHSVHPLCLVYRDAGGTVRGGLVGEVVLQWLQVDKFWVDETLRGQGIGGALLAAAEAEARRLGAVGVHLNTSSFQAPAFYHRHGFAEIGRLEGRPPGHDRFWMAKRF
jgi:predicted N-acetyltransferase YhbS